SITEFSPTAVVDTELQGDHVVLLSALLGVGEFVDHALPQPWPSPCPANPHPECVKFVAPAMNDVAVESHKKPHLVGGTAPVFGGEGGRRQGLNPYLDGSVDDIEERRFAGFVALGPRKSVAGRPPTVAVHHQCDVSRHQI